MNGRRTPVEGEGPSGEDLRFCVADWERAAARRLPPGVWDYYRGGAGDLWTVSENEAAWSRRPLRPRVLVDVARVDTTTTVLGQQVASPILVAPSAFHGLCCAEGERASVRAAGRLGAVFVNSSLSNESVEDVCTDARAPVWFQLYVLKDRAATETVVARAVAAGCRALVLTVDAPWLGRRERDVRNGFHLPPGLTAKNLLPAGLGDVPRDEGGPGSGLAAWFQERIERRLQWADLRWLRSLSSLPLVLKGILHPDDARRAADEGVEAIVVSNHGGRQLDGAIATADALGPVIDAVADRIEVYVDGGLRRGVDVLRALALGARAAMVARPLLWGLAVGGEDGAAAVLGLLRDELELAMALAGTPSIAAVGRSLLAP